MVGLGVLGLAARSTTLINGEAVLGCFIRFAPPFSSFPNRQTATQIQTLQKSLLERRYTGENEVVSYAFPEWQLVAIESNPGLEATVILKMFCSQFA